MFGLGFVNVHKAYANLLAFTKGKRQQSTGGRQSKDLDGATHPSSREEIMNTLTTQADPVDFPIHELEQIESTILASQKKLKSLEARREELTRELERVTRPPTTLAKTTATKLGQGYSYRGDFTRRSKSVDIYLDVLRRVWADFPEKRETIASAVSAKGRTRAYIAKTATELFPNRTLAWVELHNRRLADGWYVDTNLSRNQMSGLLPVAVKAAGLKWGNDVKVYW